jgi:hypothetical protein
MTLTLESLAESSFSMDAKIHGLRFIMLLITLLWYVFFKVNKCCKSRIPPKGKIMAT